MKKFLSGLIAGLILCLSSVVFAQEFQALTASFKVFINGSEFVSDKPAVVINGSTYLPLKAVGDALGVKVVWNNDLGRVEIGEEKEVSKYSRTNPAPLKEKQVSIVEDYSEQYTTEVTVKEILRGDNAWSMLQQTNQYNEVPIAGHDYMLAKIELKLLDINDDKALSISPIMFSLFSSDYKKYDYTLLVTPDPQIRTDLYKGASVEGWVVFQVKTEDTKPTIVFGQDYDGTGGVWFKAY